MLGLDKLNRLIFCILKGPPMARVSIEDCMKKLPNRFALVVVAANRARQLMGSNTPLIKTTNKPAVAALREIAEGKVIAKKRYKEDEEVVAEE
jgi:DNA-directed RNA polymerase subunit omega